MVGVGGTDQCDDARPGAPAQIISDPFDDDRRVTHSAPVVVHEIAVAIEHRLRGQECPLPSVAPAETSSLRMKPLTNFTLAKPRRMPLRIFLVSGSFSRRSGAGWSP